MLDVLQTWEAQPGSQAAVLLTVIPLAGGTRAGDLERLEAGSLARNTRMVDEPSGGMGEVMEPVATKDLLQGEAPQESPTRSMVIGLLIGATVPVMFLVRFAGVRLNVSAGDVIIGLLGALMLLRLYRVESPWPALRLLGWPMSLFVGWMALTSGLSIIRYESVGIAAVRELLKYGADLVWLLVTVAAFRNERVQRGFVMAWYFAAVALSVGAIATRIAAWPMPVRPELTFENPNALAFFLGASITAPWWVTRVWRVRRAWITVPLIFLGVLATGSRGGTLGAGAGLVWLLAIWLRQVGLFTWRRLIAVGLVGVGLVALLLLTPPGREGAGRVFGASHLFMVDDRLELWQDSWMLYQQSPWIGIGPGMFATLRETVLGRENKNAHNEYLTALTEQGPVGLVAILALLGTALGYAWRHSPRNPGAVAGGGIMAHSVVHGFVSNVFQLRLFWIGFALILVAAAEERTVQARASEHL